MKDPILTFQKYDNKKNEITDVCKIQLQYFEKDAITELWDYEVNDKGEWKRAFKCGEINSREHTNKVLFSENGYVYSFAKAYAKSADYNEHDHLIVKFTGYDNGVGAITVLLDLAQYKYQSEQQHMPIIDDYDLLMQKYNELT